MLQAADSAASAALRGALISRTSYLSPVVTVMDAARRSAPKFVAVLVAVVVAVLSR